jgi:hypothetical protein
MSLNKFFASTFLLCSTLTLSACGGGHGLHDPHIDELSVEPSVIPAPTEGHPVQFKVRVRARAENNSELALVTPIRGDALNEYYPIERAHCNACEDELVEIVCTSAVSPTDPQSRMLSCPTTASMYYFPDNSGAFAHKIGPQQWGLLLTPASRAVGGKGANLLAKTDWRTVQVTIQ